MIYILFHLIFVMMLGYYLILNLQWYNYRFIRIVLHHHNPYMHIFLFLTPLFAYYALREYVWALDILYGAALYLWQRKLDKKLVFTSRVKRFFLILAFITLFLDAVAFFKFNLSLLPTLLPLVLALLISNLLEKMLFMGYKNEAKKRLEEIDPLIVAVTASYGKTSIKNFIYQLVKDDFNAYKTPRSVNTLAGILKDINEKLPKECGLYIVEAGARQRGDIAQISSFLNPHYAVVAKVGEQHLEYFKTLQNIILTKLELIKSNRLKKAFIWDGIDIKPRDEFIKFGKNIKNIKANLDGVKFDMDIDGRLHSFKAPILGDFNALNIAAAILVAKELGIELEEIKKRVAKLKSIEHRLQKIEAGGKTIIDDSFNGNLEGMIASYELVKDYKGRKIVVTPGIMESTDEANEKLAKKIDEVFDMVVITGKINREILSKNISKPKIILDDKEKLQDVLAKNTKAGDLILFSNDAPAYM